MNKTLRKSDFIFKQNKKIGRKIFEETVFPSQFILLYPFIFPGVNIGKTRGV
jgi:hypothetical protein